VINLMPRLETYEPSLVGALARAGGPGEDVQFAWLRLATHGYRSSDPAHLEAHYRSYDAAMKEAPLDGLLLTGAPVETLEFEAVHYWEELAGILRRARSEVPSTLGVCWGAMALAALEGISKVTLPRKVFGAFSHELSAEGRAWLPSLGATYRCAQSRHAGLEDASVERAIRGGRVVPLARGVEAGSTLLATRDRRVLMHLGHPEYEPSRITFEWERDRSAGRPDVTAPAGFDEEGQTPQAPWEADSRAFFRAWLDDLKEARSLAAAAAVVA
jgi:homoserine O-succinyltransferase